MPHADVCFWHKADIARRTGGRPLSTQADILNGGTLSRQCNSLGLDAFARAKCLPTQSLPGLLASPGDA